MVGATDVEKLRMQIRWLKKDIWAVIGKAWWTSERLKEANTVGVPKYFVDTYGISEAAINEAYFLGRQDGRLSMAEEIRRIVGEKDNDFASATNQKN